MTSKIESEVDLVLLVAPSGNSGPGSPKLEGWDCESFRASDAAVLSSRGDSVGSSDGGVAIAITAECEVKAGFGVDERRVPEADTTIDPRVEDLVTRGEVLVEFISFRLLLSGVTTPIEGLLSYEL